MFQILLYFGQFNVAPMALSPRTKCGPCGRVGLGKHASSRFGERSYFAEKMKARNGIGVYSLAFQM